MDGFSLHGKVPKSCACDVCRQAKIRRRATVSVSPYSEAATYVGHTVSTDVKSLPYASMRGYKYVIVYVDHYSSLSVCYFMRHKNETASTLRRYLREMQRLGVSVRTIQSDRGSEYFSQEGSSAADRDRRMAEFTKICTEATPMVHHVVTAVEMKEKRAEVWFRVHFEAADCMLWEARLSPVFWADAIMYSCFLANRTPLKPNMPTTPWETVTGMRARWDKLKVFGCDVFEHIPNNSLAKVPGLPKGRRLLFMGFNPLAAGWKVFDPETRRYFSVNDAYFYEDMRPRIDSLRHHDRRWAMVKAGQPVPFVADDFDRDTLTRAQAVRNLYLDANAPSPLAAITDQLANVSEGATESASEGGSSSPLRGEDGVQLPSGEQAASLHQRGPLRKEAQRAERARNVLRQAALLRPLRTSAVGIPLKLTVEDKTFLEHAKRINAPLKFHSPCPKKGASKLRYLKYMHASSYNEALLFGATNEDIKWDHLRGYICWPKHEPDLPGHVFNAFDVAERHGHTHILHDLGLYVSKSDETDFKLAQAFASLKRSTQEADRLNEMLKNAYEPDGILSLFEQRKRAGQWADTQMGKVLSAASKKIHLSLSPEPLRFEEAMDSDESIDWKKAMDDEMKSMQRFDVCKLVPKSSVRGRQILGCRWVYKRKIGEDGRITRYRARLVAKGFLQRPYDSFQPDECYSPVISKDSLRLCAAENLRVYQADVKAAFLQAPLSEKIYMRAPPGYERVDEHGEEYVMELSKAVYGLKQASASFWSALNEHVLDMGFTAMTGDPCFFKKVLPNGKPIYVNTYIDDVTYASADQESADHFLAELRKRFVIEEGEGKPISWLLNMRVKQDLVAGTIKLDQELAITQLAEAILSPEELAKASSVRYPMLGQGLKKQTERTCSKEEFDYLSVVGSLLHLANCTRCDVAHAVGALTRHAQWVGHAHVRAAKRVVQYLYNTRSLGITYRRDYASATKNVPLMYEGAKHPLDNGTNLLQTFADSDYAADDTKRSTIGVVVMMNGGPISWASILGKTVATSTCEAEVNAAVVAAKDALHLSQMLFDLGVTTKKQPLQIGEDNAACIAQAKSGIRHVKNAKHYQVKLRFLQRLVVDKDVDFVYCPTDQQLADFFTKPLVDGKFTYFRDQIFGAGG